MPKSKELVSSSSSASDSDSEIDKKAKRKKQAVPEKPLKKQKMGESSKRCKIDNYFRAWFRYHNGTVVPEVSWGSSSAFYKLCKRCK
uniref:Uncharacterized protein n=1 Tax=Meleagris gallopavo TaxID=9103 RepID=A0A803XR43_MELGA